MLGQSCSPCPPNSAVSSQLGRVSPSAKPGCSGHGCHQPHPRACCSSQQQQTQAGPAVLSSRTHAGPRMGCPHPKGCPVPTDDGPCSVGPCSLQCPSPDWGTQALAHGVSLPPGGSPWFPAQGILGEACTDTRNCRSCQQVQPSGRHSAYDTAGICTEHREAKQNALDVPVEGLAPPRPNRGH